MSDRGHRQRRPEPESQEHRTPGVSQRRNEVEQGRKDSDAVTLVERRRRDVIAGASLPGRWQIFPFQRVIDDGGLPPYEPFGPPLAPLREETAELVDDLVRIEA